MLAPAMRAKLIEELEYQHENAATPENMIREDPLNYEAYAMVRSKFCNNNLTIRTPTRYTIQNNFSLRYSLRIWIVY